MQAISAQPLIDKFRNGTFEEAEAGPYFMAYMIIGAIPLIMTYEDRTPWDVAVGFASIVIMIFGIIHLKKQNGDTYGDLFLAKFICLGWVITVRMILLAIPVGVLFSAFTSILGGLNAAGPIGTIIWIVSEIIFYWWLGSLIAQSNSPKSDGGQGNSAAPRASPEKFA